MSRMRADMEEKSPTLENRIELRDTGDCIVPTKIEYRRRVLIAGAGWRSVGVDAILIGNIERVRSTFPSPIIVVLSSDVERIKLLHKEVQICKAHSLKMLLEFIRMNDLIIGGGTPLKTDQATFSCFVALLAKLLRKKVHFFAAGASPSKAWSPHVPPKRVNGLPGFLIKLVTNIADSMTVRDVFSKKVLEMTGTNRPLQIVPDPSLFVRPIEPKEARNILEKEGIFETHPMIAVSLKRSVNNEVDQKVKRVMSQVIDWLIENNVKVIFLPFCFERGSVEDDDSKFAEALQKLTKNKFIVLKRYCTPSEMKGIIALMDLLIGMRYHSMLFAWSVGIPFIGMIYDVKNEAFLKSIRQDGFYIDQLSFHSLRNAIGLEISKRAKQLCATCSNDL